jgi:hypothetical protein
MNKIKEDSIEYFHKVLVYLEYNISQNLFQKLVYLHEELEFPLNSSLIDLNFKKIEINEYLGRPYLNYDKEYYELYKKGNDI